MPEILLINASPRPETSAGYRLANELVEQLSAQQSGWEVTRRDLQQTPLAPLDAAYANALTRRTPETEPVFITSQALINEVERSDLLLIATPMHNFTVPASLKLWIDHVVRIGRTFAVTPDGKVGLLADRPVYVIVSSGGLHQGPQAGQPDFLSPYLRHVLHTIGLSKVRFIYLQGLVAGQDRINAECETARRELLADPLFQGLA
jgi:FMN-dependent NADH-azoreductase